MHYPKIKANKIVTHGAYFSGGLNQFEERYNYHLTHVIEVSTLLRLIS